jgi:hypothetical protein
MMWILLLWLYLAGMGATFAIDRSSWTLFWFTVVMLGLWPVWVTLVALRWCWTSFRDRNKQVQHEQG